MRAINIGCWLMGDNEGDQHRVLQLCITSSNKPRARVSKEQCVQNMSVCNRSIHTILENI